MTSLGTFGIQTLTSTLLGLMSSSTSRSASTANGSSDFSSSLQLRLAEMQSSAFSTLTGSLFGSDAKSGSALDFLNTDSSLSTANNAIQGLAANGRNLSLFDPESAYSMMSAINGRDVSYKAQFAELSEMTATVAELQKAGATLGDRVDADSNGEAIKTQLQTFVGKYNAWIERFGGSVGRDGVLAGTQAAEVSLHELEQSIGNLFNGAADGFHGMRDLGLTIDPMTKRASLDTKRLDAALAVNASGAVRAIDEFAGNFAKSAELLGSTNNFLPNRLANLDRVIDYISEHKTALQAEFGLGDPARPSPKVAAALATYQRIASQA